MYQPKHLRQQPARGLLWCCTLAALAVLAAELILFRQGKYFLFTGIWNDFHLRWQESRYLLRGADPIAVLRGQLPADAEIGEIWGAGGSVPWAYVWNIPCTFAWLPYEQALALARVLYPLTGLLLTVWLGFAVARKGGAAAGVCAAVLLLSSPAHVSSLQCGSNGYLLTVLLLLSVLYEEQNPRLSAVLLAFTAVKPQLCGLFFAAKLLRRPLHTIAAGAAGVLVPWLAAGWLCGTSPLTMLLEIWQQGSGVYFAHCNFGLFSALYRGGVCARGAAILLSAALCSILVGAAALHSCAKPAVWHYLPAALCTPLWMYLNDNDYAVLLLPLGVLLAAAVRLQQSGRPGLGALLAGAAMVLWQRPHVRLGIIVGEVQTGSLWLDFLVCNGEMLLWAVLLVAVWLMHREQAKKPAAIAG